MREYVLVFIKKMMEIYIVLAKIIDYEINAVANYILKKYEIY
jgi:putative flippase GtrA